MNVPKPFQSLLSNKALIRLAKSAIGPSNSACSNIDDGSSAPPPPPPRPPLCLLGSFITCNSSKLAKYRSSSFLACLAAPPPLPSSLLNFVCCLIALVHVAWPPRNAKNWLMILISATNLSIKKSIAGASDSRIGLAIAPNALLAYSPDVAMLSIAGAKLPPITVEYAYTLFTPVTIA